MYPTSWNSAPKVSRSSPGDDFTVLPHIAVGGCGVISVTANVAPKLMADLCKATLAGDMDEARRLHFKLMPINRAMFLETNPIPVKTRRMHDARP